MLKTDVVCVGSATVDHFLTTEQRLNKIRVGDKILVKSKEVHTGGGATNSAAALSKLGLKVKVLTKLGDDHEAEFIVKELKKYKIKFIKIKTSKHSTDSATIMSSIHGRDRIAYVNKAASMDLSIKDFKKSQLNARWIYMASLLGKSLKTGKEIAKYAKKKKISLLFNPSLYLAKQGVRKLRPFLMATTALVLNVEEAQALTNTKKPTPELLELLQKTGPKIVVITNAYHKLHAINEDKIYTLMPPDVKIVHTLGAGDSFTAGLVAGLIKKWSFEDCLRLAQVNSTSVIQHVGTKSILLDEKEAKASMKKFGIKVSVSKK
jgi:pseudouridine kinase